MYILFLYITLIYLIKLIKIPYQENIYYSINNNIKFVHGKVKHPQSQGACESCHKEIKKYLYNKFLEDKIEFNILNAIWEITNIHNNKRLSNTNEIPRELNDLNDANLIREIQDRMKKVISQKNKNKDIIDVDDFYVINSNLIIRGNKILNNHKKLGKKRKIIRITINVLSETDNDEEVIIEIKKNVDDFKEGENYIIKVNLLEITTESIWKNLL